MKNNQRWCHPDSQHPRERKPHEPRTKHCSKILGSYEIEEQDFSTSKNIMIISQKVYSNSHPLLGNQSTFRCFIWSPCHFFGEESLVEAFPVSNFPPFALSGTATQLVGQAWYKCLIRPRRDVSAKILGRSDFQNFERPKNRKLFSQTKILQTFLPEYVVFCGRGSGERCPKRKLNRVHIFHQSGEKTLVLWHFQTYKFNLASNKKHQQIIEIHVPRKGLHVCFSPKKRQGYCSVFLWLSWIPPCYFALGYPYTCFSTRKSGNLGTSCPY